MSTAIHEIHGNVPQNELADRGKELGSYSGYVPISELTSGEFRLHLLYKELVAIEKMYPECRAVTRKAKSMIDNALWTGLHNGGHTVASVGALYDPMLQTVARNINAFKGRSTPAMRTFSTRRGVKHIGEAIIPARTCTPPVPKRDDNGHILPMDFGPYNKCIAQKNFETLANGYLEKASAHVMYEFLSEVISPNSAPTIVGVKYVMQTGAVNNIRDIGGVWSRSDLKEWFRLGIKMSNAAEGAGLLSPKDSILELIENRDKPGVNGANIGNPLAFIAVVKVLIAAITAITGMIVAIKASSRGNDAAAIRLYELQSQGLGTKNYSSNTTDWQGGTLPPVIPPGTTPSSNNDLLIAGGLGLAAFFLLKD